MIEIPVDSKDLSKIIYRRKKFIIYLESRDKYFIPNYGQVLITPKLGDICCYQHKNKLRIGTVNYVFKRRHRLGGEGYAVIANILEIKSRYRHVKKSICSLHQSAIVCILKVVSKSTYSYILKNKVND